jgi:fatty-acyl-CoA synthase
MSQTVPTTPEKGEKLRALIRALDALRTIERSPSTTLLSCLDELGRTHGTRPALLGTHEQFSYRQLIDRTRRVAGWARAHQLASEPGRPRTVALLMPNRPEYVALWLGLTRAGCIVALINTNLAGEALLHSIRTAGVSHLIVDAELLSSVADRLPPAVRVWVHGGAGSAGWPAFDPDSSCLADPRPDGERAPCQSDLALLIYTSGTTGMPKAAKVTHGRILEWSLWFAGIMDVQPSDRLYDCLPLYHSTGGIVAIGAMLIRGGSVMIARRFSVSRFWDDVSEGNCTIFQYIGELCRYLAQSPPHPKEGSHKLRLACGNGLQGDVWQAFQTRFQVPRILEFYAATEGNVSLYNWEGKAGAIGRVPPFLAGRFGVALIRVDPESGLVERDALGRCIPCAADEIGEAIGRTEAASAVPARCFDGYTDLLASERKLLRDVFAPGDRWFRTGDLMRRDAAGFFYFVDRLGDTFRWKGENVSSTEVAAVLRACPGVTDAVVYGVAVPGHEGRAGMAALTTDGRFELERLYAHISSALPGYARPVFIRLCRRFELTGTFKLIKSKLADEGYAGLADPVWYSDRAQKRYVPCDERVLDALGRKAA